MTMIKRRCGWCDESSELYVEYHDTQWGVPVSDDRLLFEMLILEGMQAGLSWITILRKRSNFLAAFDNFDCRRVARYDEARVAALLTDEGIVRNRLKVLAAVRNAAVCIDLQKEYGSFADYLWNWVDYRPLQNSYEVLSDLPARTDLSEKVSRDLKKRGMNFVGPTIIYAFMQAVGMVNDHLISCFRHAECMGLAEQFAEAKRQ